MRTILLLAVALPLIGPSPAHATRRVRIGPTYSSLGLEDLSGSSHTFSSFGGSAALITGEDGESRMTITRDNDLSTLARVTALATDRRGRRPTLFGLDSYYYPVGARGVVAPFAGTTLGLARVAESRPGCLLLCGDTVSTASQLALAFGLGVRVNVGSAAVATLEGRFLQVPGSDIQALEAVANASIAPRSAHKGG